MSGDRGASELRGTAVDGGSGQRAPGRRGRGLLIPALVFLALAIIVSLAGWAIFRRQANDMRAESAGALLAVHKVQSAQVSRWFADEVHDVRLVASAQSIAEPLERYMKGPGGALPESLRSALELYRRGHNIHAVLVLGPGLGPVARSPVDPATGGPPGPTPQESRVAAEALRRDGPAFSGVYLAPDGAAMMDFATPLRDLTPSPDRVTGVVVLRELPAETVFPLLQVQSASLPSGKSVLVARRGDNVALASPLSLGEKLPREFTRPLADTSLPAVQAVLGRRGITEGVDYRGKPILAAVGKVAGTPWWLVTKQDLAVVDQPISDRGWATLAWVVGLIVLAGVAVLLYLRSRETRTLRELVALEQRRSRAEEQYSALMREAKEIVILIDGAGRIVEANDFALAAYGFSRDELVGQVVDVVRAEPAGLSLEDRRRALEEAGGRMTVESVHRRRDGVEFPVEVGLSSVVLEGEPYYLEIVRDIGERKAAEVALRDSEARYRALFESALSGFALLEAVPGHDGAPVDFVVVAANAAFETQTGVPVEGIVGRRVSEAIPGIRDSDALEAAVKVVTGGEPERFEVFYAEAGRHLDLQFATPRPGQLAAMVLDVTERRQIEGILSGFFEGSPVGLFILDSELRYVRVNDTLAAMDRVPAADHLGRTLGEVVPGIWELAEPSLRRVLDSGEPLRGVEIALASPSDPASTEHALLSLFPIADPEGGVRSVGGVVVDITETKRAERELAENKDFLEHVLGVTPEVIYIFDIVEQRNVFSNREMFELLGYSPEEVRDMGNEVLARILHPDDRDALAAHHRRAVDLADSEVLEVEYRMRRADGEWRILHGRDTVFARDEHGLVTQLIGTAQDVTEQRGTEERARQLGERLEATVMASPLAIVAVSQERLVQLWNPAAEAIFGWAAEEVVGRARRSSRRSRWPRWTPSGAAWLPANSSPVWTCRACARTAAASTPAPRWRSCATRAASPESVLMIIEDVTERRANVVRLARLTRLYQMLSAVTEAIPEERDPGRLYARVCRIVVEQGGFRAAWVGRNAATVWCRSSPRPGRRAPLRPPAAAQSTDSFGNVGVALAEGRSEACRDIAADPRMAAVHGRGRDARRPLGRRPSRSSSTAATTRRWRCIPPSPAGSTTRSSGCSSGSPPTSGSPSRRPAGSAHGARPSGSSRRSTRP